MASRDEQRPSTVTIRWSLIRNLSLLLVFLTGFLLLTTVYTGDHIARFVVTSLLQRSLDTVEAKLLSFLEPAPQSLIVARRMVRDGTLDLEDPEALNRHFEPIMASIPRLSGVNVGDERGRSFLLMRFPDTGRWRNRLTRPDEWGHRLEFREWGGGEPAGAWSVAEPPPDEAYDPRSRTWYQVAREDAAREEPGEALPEGVYWTKPYRFFTTGDFGITAMVYVEAPDGTRSILAIDLLLQDISKFTRGLPVSENGYGAILDEDGGLLGLPGLARFDDPAAREAAFMKSPIDSGVPTLHAAGVAYRSFTEPPTNFTFESGGEDFWADLSEVTLGENRKVMVAILVPSSDLVGPVHELRVLLVGVSVLGFAAAMVMSIVLARRYSRPLSMLAENSERIGSLDLRERPRVASSLREVEQLATEQERMRLALDSFSRYVPVDVVRELMTRGEAARIGGSRCEVTALFTDIRGFTSIAEGMEPEVLTAHLAEYFEELLGIVQGDGFGTVTQLTGDGLVGFWGAPTPDENHAAHAAAAVLACGERLAERNLEWARAGKPELYTRFGLASGAAVVGNVGAASRLVYTAIGDTINLASRLEGMGRFYGTSVQASGATRAAAGDGFEWRLLDAVRVKGKSQVVEIFELLGAAGTVSEAELAAARGYEEALGLYRKRRFPAAREALEALLRDCPGDASLARLLELARSLEGQPPGERWDGVTEYSEK